MGTTGRAAGGPRRRTGTGRTVTATGAAATTARATESSADGPAAVGTTADTADTAAVAGMVYLRRPAGAPAAHRRPAPSASAGPGEDVRAVIGGGSADARSAAAAEIGRLLRWWLEAYDGVRPVAALRRGPWSPVALDDLRAQIRSAAERRHGVPSRLLRVHLPPSHRRRLSFTASAVVDGRVRALVGHLARYDTRWRVESVTLV